MQLKVRLHGQKFINLSRKYAGQAQRYFNASINLIIYGLADSSEPHFAARARERLKGGGLPFGHQTFLTLELVHYERFEYLLCVLYPTQRANVYLQKALPLCFPVSLFEAAPNKHTDKVPNPCCIDIPQATRLCPTHYSRSATQQLSPTSAARTCSSRVFMDKSPKNWDLFLP